LFYEKLLDLLRQPVVREGQWRLLECAPAWEGNGSWDSFLAFAWEAAGAKRLLVVINYAPHQSQGYIRLPFSDFSGRPVRLKDAMHSAIYDRDGSDLSSRGFYADMAPWDYYVLEIT
jgi:hypothetical protein